MCFVMEKYYCLEIYIIFLVTLILCHSCLMQGPVKFNETQDQEKSDVMNPNDSNSEY